MANNIFATPYRKWGELNPAQQANALKRFPLGRPEGYQYQVDGDQAVFCRQPIPGADTSTTRLQYKQLAKEILEGIR